MVYPHVQEVRPRPVVEANGDAIIDSGLLHELGGMIVHLAEVHAPNGPDVLESADVPHAA